MTRRVKQLDDPSDPRYQMAFKDGREARIRGEPVLWPVKYQNYPELSNAFDAGYAAEHQTQLRKEKK